MTATADPDANEQLFFKIAALENKHRGLLTEQFIAKCFNLTKSNTTKHDLKDNLNRIEVKSSIVKRKPKYDNILEVLNLPVSFLSEDEAFSETFLCNFQNVKLAEFDKMFYVIYFRDKIKVYKADIADFIQDKNLNLSIKTTDLGQFGVTENNINYHNDKYLHNTYSYTEFFNMLKNT